jgi:hypothetical protein
MPAFETAHRPARTAVLTLAGLLAALMLIGAGAAGARALHTVLQDDQAALFEPARLDRFVHTLKHLGVDELRVSAEWKLEAPDAARPPAGFQAGNPRSYDASPAMQALDRAVRAAASQRIGVIVDPAFSAPRWATNDPPPRVLAGDPWYNRDIDVRELAAWEAMLATRYSGHYTPSGQRRRLPRVGTFTLWNEPNQSGFVSPQWRGGVPASADWSRSLLRLAYPAIKRASPGATVLIGNTSPTGADTQAGNRGVPPLAFIRRMACVDAQLQPIATGACAHFRELPADGYSQHPYERSAPPWTPSGAPDNAEMGDLLKLQALLDRLVAMHRLAPGARNLWLTEQGYQSDGQLGNQPWSEAQQAVLNADAEYVAWHDPQVVSFAQFLLRDTLTAQTLALRARTGNRRVQVGGTWTTGLQRQDGTPKPAQAMFRAPVVARFVAFAPLAGWLFSAPAGPPAQVIEVWGRARAMHSRTLVVVEAHDDGIWRTISETPTDANGIFDVHAAVAALVPVEVRFRWLDSRGRWHTSPVNGLTVMR